MGREETVDEPARLVPVAEPRAVEGEQQLPRDAVPLVAPRGGVERLAQRVDLLLRGSGENLRVGPRGRGREDEHEQQR